MSPDQDCLSYWYPRIREHVPTPRTLVVHALCDLTQLLDGKAPQGYSDFIEHLTYTAAMIGYPAFLRTGHTSGKHDWEETCHVSAPFQLKCRVARLVEFSEMADFMGLPTNIWAVRQMLPTKHLFRAFPGSMPITREFRLFADGERVTHWQPYWPEAAIEQPTEPDWQERLRKASQLTEHEFEELSKLAITASSRAYGHWSVDLLETELGWYVTDMATAERSFKYEHNASLNPTKGDQE